MSDCSIFRVMEAGKLTVLGFGDDGAPNHFYHDECFDELEALIVANKSDTIIFDLTRVDFLASGMIGMLQWLKHRGVNVVLRNASNLIRTALMQLQVDIETTAQPAA